MDRRYKTLNLNKPVFIGRTPTGGTADPYRLHWLALRQKELQFFAMRLTHHEYNPTEYKQSCDAELISVDVWDDYVDRSRLVIRSQHPILNDPICYPEPSEFPFEWAVSTRPNESIRCRQIPPIEMGGELNRHSLICRHCQSYDLIWMKKNIMFVCKSCGKYARVPRNKKTSSHHRAKSFALQASAGDVVEVFNLRQFCLQHGYPYENFHVRVVQHKACYKGWRLAPPNLNHG